MKEDGEKMVKEMELKMEEGREYVSEEIKKGINVDDFEGRMQLLLEIGMNLLMEIEKLRDERMIW